MLALVFEVCSLVHVAVAVGDPHEAVRCAAFFEVRSVVSTTFVLVGKVVPKFGAALLAAVPKLEAASICILYLLVSRC